MLEQPVQNSILFGANAFVQPQRRDAKTRRNKLSTFNIQPSTSAACRVRAKTFYAAWTRVPHRRTIEAPCQPGLMEFAKTFYAACCVRVKPLYAAVTPAEIKIVEGITK
jgi:hypothetical protein